MIRAFLAIELPEDLRRALTTLQQDLKRQLERMVDRQSRITWVRPASMHLTVRFLGDMPDESIEPLRLAVEQAVSAHRAIAVPLERLGVFPRLQQPRVLWVGSSESWEQSDEAKRLATLHRAIEDCCQAADFAPESRPFSPHLTLARIKEGERQVGQALAQCGAMDRPVTIGVLLVGAMTLMKSELCPTGSIYTKLWEVGIGGTCSES
ncbi:MAG: putative 2-5 ligase [Nitrospira sp.]|jgi:2'-5' RNA ligase|nr:putative 2-5 ligase [Nitrospira sp.]